MGCIPKVAIGMEKLMINQWILGVFPQFSDKAKTEANCVCAVKDDGGQPVATVVCENDCLLHNLNLLKRFALNRPGSRPHNWWILVDGFKHDSVIHDASFQVHRNSGAQVLGISWYC